MILIILCTVQAVKARKIPENFNEAKYGDDDVGGDEDDDDDDDDDDGDGGDDKLLAGISGSQCTPPA